MTLMRPYYPPHQISPGKYTSGGEFMLADGTEYIGPYHILQNGWVYTEFKPELVSQRLFTLNVRLTEDAKRYNVIVKRPISQYTSPVPYTVIPTMEDYKRGELFRYFVQKRNNPLLTIIEIDVDQYMSINTKGMPGINGIIYNSTVFQWVISKIDIETVHQINLNKIVQAELEFPGIGVYLRNPTEFYR